MITVERHATKRDKITFVSENWFRDKERISMLPGARYSSVTHEWTAPLSWSACLTLRGIFGDELVIGPELTQWATDEKNNRVEPSLRLRQAMEIEPGESTLGTTELLERVAADERPLYSFQQSGVLFLSTARQALLLDDMGTGKTRQTIETLRLLDELGENVFPIIIVCPKPVMTAWAREFESWWPGLTVSVISGGAAGRRKAINERAQVNIINLEAVRFNSRLSPYGSIRLRHCHVCDTSKPDIKGNEQSKCERCRKELNEIAWRTVIVDEAHRMKDPKAKQTRACWALATDDTEFRFALTGTAIANAPHDLWPSLHLVAPHEWPSRREYIERYCLQSFANGEVIGLKPEMKSEFFRIVDPRIRRMPKSAVLTQLPDKVYTIRYVDMPPAQAKPYHQIESGMIARLDEGLVIASNPLAQLTRLSQFASATCELDENGDVRMSAPSNKVDALVDLLDDYPGQLVVFAESRQLIDIAARRLDKEKVSYETVVGGQSAFERQSGMDRFQNGHARIMLCTIAAGGVGITLTAANTVVFLQRSWSMVNNSQAEDRVHRIGSEIHDSINVVDIISNDSYESRQREVLGDKLELLEEMMRDRELLRRILNAGK